MPGSLGKSSGLPGLPRRYKTIFALTVTLFSVIYLLSAINAPSTVPVPATLREHLPLPALPGSSSLQKINPFSAPAHKPPVQTNSSDGETKWHADWRWLLPFSSEVTQDDERVVLPPLQTRPPIYTYYEPNKKKPKDVLREEEELLLQWRKAWWAQGFKPVVLGRVEALNNPLYKKVQMLNLEDNIEMELARWLAWGNMGAGILADSRLFPMAKYDNALLSFLRRASYPQITRYQGLRAGLFCGDEMHINKFIEDAIKHTNLKTALNFADPMFSDLFRIESARDGVAFYDSENISKLYKAVSDPLLGDNELKGLQLLGDVINAHLQNTWQASFVEISVLKPIPKFTTTMVEPALHVAGNLTACPRIDPSILGTCPPNRPKCKKCLSATPIPITTPAAIRNKTDKFYIGTVPHPYTMTALVNNREQVDGHFVRRLGFKDRDSFLAAVTADSLVGANEKKLGVLKAAVASDWATSRTLWLTAEDDDVLEKELPWLFGFRLPHTGSDLRAASKSETPVPGPERRPPPPEEKEEGRARVAEDLLAGEQRLLAKAREAVHTTNADAVRRREAVEMWNMGDSEAWRFVKAFGVRRRMVRRNWEKEESKFAGSERKGVWGRWWDDE